MYKKINANLVNEKIVSNSDKKIHFCFKYGFALYSVSTKEFTNYYKDENSFIKFINGLLTNDIPELSVKTFDEIKKEKRHYHKIEEDKLAIVKKIIKEILKEKELNWNCSQISRFMEQNILDTNIFQIGTKNGVRLIGILTDDIFEILFFDIYHLIYPSQKHNMENYHVYKYSSIEKERLL